MFGDQWFSHDQQWLMNGHLQIQMFCFSVMESSFCLAKVKFITVLETSLMDDLGAL